MVARKKTQPATTTTKNETPDYIVRLREEIREVNDRLHKISEFETTKTFKKLSAYQKDLLVAQSGAMLAYRNILNIRCYIETKHWEAAMQGAAK